MNKQASGWTVDVVVVLQEELSALRYQVKELELGVHKQQMLQDRAQDERARLAAENEQLRQQASRYSQQLERVSPLLIPAVWSRITPVANKHRETVLTWPYPRRLLTAAGAGESTFNTRGLVANHSSYKQT